MASVAQVIEFWFGDDPDDAQVITTHSHLWWKKDQSTDEECRRRFAESIQRAMSGELDAWTRQPSGRLALIILLDQFSRNVYRDQPQAFSQDSRALALALEGLEQGVDLSLRPIERVFFYLPLEHAESLELQKQSVACYERLAEEASPELEKAFAGFLNFAVRHYEIVERFGRFPHRNAILKRTSTAEEEAFLSLPGSSF